MKYEYLSAIFLAGFLTFSINSCTSEDQPASIKGQTTQVSFAIMMPEGIQSKATTESSLGDTPWKSYTQCMSQFDKDGKPIPSNPDFPIVANMNITRSEDGTGPADLNVKVNIIKRADGSYVTDPITVDAGKTYTINTLTITDDTNLSLVYFSGVASGAAFAPYVSQTLPQTFNVAAYTKPTIDVWVLCARGFEPEKFGKPKFDINRVEVSCIPIFVDVCDSVGEDFVASGSIALQKLDQATEPAITDFTSGKVIDNLTSGYISYLCFADNLDKADNEEWYLITVTYKDPNGDGNITQQEVVTLEALKKYKTSSSWNATYNYLDILICGNTFCLFRCENTPNDCSSKFFEGFEDVNSPADLAAKGWSGFSGSESIVPGGVPTSGKYMLAAGTDNKGDDNYNWITGKFQYVTGDKISMDLNAFIKFDDWDNSNTKADDKDPGHDGGYVTVKINLISTTDNSVTEFGTASFKITKHNSGTWLQDKPVLVSAKPIPTGCYKMELEITLPGYGWAIDPQTGEAKHWYDV
ncbi:MAG: hypothetical protein ACRDCN_00080, partial [Tannerellaceae bacterium]